MNTTFLAYSVLALLCAGFFAVLFAALRETGDAGILRLIEKQPESEQRFEYWSTRWNLLRTTLRFCLTVFEIVAICLALLATTPDKPLQWIAMILITAILYMIFIRVIPFVLAESFADRLTLLFLSPVIALTRLLTPIVWPIYALERGLLKHALSSSDEDDRPSAEDEIMTLVEESADEELEEDERDIIRSVFEFGETVTREIMTPRVDIDALKDKSSIAECVEKIQSSRHSRFPVYHETIDDVRGIVHVKDLLRRVVKDKKQSPVADIIKPMDLVPETMAINDLLKLMQRKNTQMSLVIDEYGGTAGIVCMEDIIEELVGEIRDEYDLAEKDIQKRPDGAILVKARLAVNDLNEELELDIPESDEYDSIGGYVISALGTIPKTGDKLSAKNLDIIVQNATPRRIHTLLLKPNK